MTARIVPVAQEDVADDLRPLLLQIAVTGGFIPNVTTTMARNPGLLRPFLGFGEHFITKSTLPDRDRELAVMRTATLSRNEYMLAHHGIIAKSSGLTDEEIERVAQGPDAPGWSESDRAVLRVVDELHARHDLDDASWKVLTDRWNEEQVVEFVLAVGFYSMSAMALNTFRTQLEPEISQGLDQRVRTS